MKRFKFLNNVVGWVICAIACAVYLLTIEPTASFWDCGEFIATANKMEVGHPPGAPFFMMLGRICSLFASDPSHVAAMINGYSALCSGFTILFLFWTITHIARRMSVSEEEWKSGQEIDLGKTIAILSSGAVGALAYTFSDTFWFSAVEGEVYASSSLFTAVVVWAILKWEDCADEPYSNRWIVAIAYLMGLSIGVHLLNLLAIPVIGLVIYYRKNEKPTGKGAIATLVISCVALVGILYGIVPGFAQEAGWFELFFVNVLGMSYSIGTIVYAVLLIGTLVYGIVITQRGGDLGPDAKKNGGIEEKDRKRIGLTFIMAMVLLGVPFTGGQTMPHILLAIGIVAGLVVLVRNYGSHVSVPTLNTVLLCCTMILVGYASYAALVIRSAANPPMDENSPDDVFALKSYLNREQYGDRPLFYGECYTGEYLRERSQGQSWSVVTEKGEPYYARVIKDDESEPDQYVHYADKETYKFCPEFTGIFPRMFSHQDSHIRAYKEWAGEPSRHITYQNMGQTHQAVAPSFMQNLKFFLVYQTGFMYWRYFMWNFVGRQNDIQGHGEITHGNWCSGIPFVDDLLNGGTTDLVPEELDQNKGHNCYYFLPLLLGIVGILYQFNKGEKGMQSFWIVCLLFAMTGLAIIVYLNQTPYQPRERDYAYAGSFYAFTIWIGLGVMWLTELIGKYADRRIAATVAALAGISVPAIMAQQNWDDHDRSNRYTCRDFGGDYLRSLAPNALIFTNGDNDTFPLWYNQEVEGECKDDSLKRAYQDKRVANLSYLQMAWYVSQMTRDMYASKGMKLSLKEKDYSLGKLDVAYVMNIINEPVSVLEAMKTLTDAKAQKKIKAAVGVMDDDMVIMPAEKLYIDIDSATVVGKGYSAAEVHNEIMRCRYERSKELEEKLKAAMAALDANKSLDAATVAKRKSELIKEHNQKIEDLESQKSYRMNISLAGKRYLGKQDLFILDLVANNNWERPIYFAVTVGNDSKMGLQQYFQLEGLAYRIVPYRAMQRANTTVMYDNMMNKFEYGNAKDPRVYLDENNQRMCNTVRNMFTMLAANLHSEQKDDSARKVVERSLKELPIGQIPLSGFDNGMIDLCYKLGMKATADSLAEVQYKNAFEYIRWIANLEGQKQRSGSYDFRQQLANIQDLYTLGRANGNSALAQKCEKVFTDYQGAIQKLMPMRGDGQASDEDYEDD